MSWKMEESDFWLGIFFVCVANVHWLAAIIIAAFVYAIGQKAFKKEEKEEKKAS